uniref:UPAR/Ly6 domain-containing protein n=2 Tax=Lates calcarifer TaxID=8187 RepID=A0A4W6C3B1_LATCA
GVSQTMCDIMLYFCAACESRCYTCVTTDHKPCTWISICPENLECCFSTKADGVIAEGCQKSLNCVEPISCCEDELCNGTIPISCRVILLLVSSAITTLFL